MTVWSRRQTHVNISRGFHPRLLQVVQEVDTACLEPKVAEMRLQTSRRRGGRVRRVSGCHWDRLPARPCFRFISLGAAIAGMSRVSRFAVTVLGSPLSTLDFSTRFAFTVTKQEFPDQRIPFQLFDQLSDYPGPVAPPSRYARRSFRSTRVRDQRLQGIAAGTIVARRERHFRVRYQAELEIHVRDSDCGNLQQLRRIQKSKLARFYSIELSSLL
jgi:hypothetical protein